SPVCQQYDRPFLIASCDHPSGNAPTVETFYSRPRNTFCQSSASTSANGNNIDTDGAPYPRTG
ncbi:hypothetical protein F1542_16600, partial [Komagataeibacter sp. FXV3]|nr:hypothetical protein [Komagataeibacter sp. FXV3]